LQPAVSVAPPLMIRMAGPYSRLILAWPLPELLRQEWSATRSLVTEIVIVIVPATIIGTVIMETRTTMIAIIGEFTARSSF
jgi:hypothetical protein